MIEIHMYTTIIKRKIIQKKTDTMNKKRLLKIMHGAISKPQDDNNNRTHNKADT